MKKKIAGAMEADEDHFETHFADNPFIRIRERANMKQALTSDALKMDAEEQDIFMVKETGRFVINDREYAPKKRQRAAKGDSEDEAELNEAEDLKSRMKNMQAAKRLATGVMSTAKASQQA